MINLMITIPTRWGNTPQNQINPTTDFGKKLLSTVGKQVTKQQMYIFK